MQPLVPEPPQEVSAIAETVNRVTAEFLIDGLAICCFNKDKKWEVAFLRREDHKLTIKITRDQSPIDLQATGLKADDDGLDPFRFRIANVQTIGISGGLAADYGTYPNGYFEEARFYKPSNIGNPKDFRWVINLQGNEDLPGHGAIKAIKKPESSSAVKSVTLATIENVILNTHQLTEAPVTLVTPRWEPPVNKLASYLTNEMIGSEIIRCPEGGGLTINIAGASPILLQEKGHYIIELSNMDKCDAPEPIKYPLPGGYILAKGDFNNYYSVVELYDGAKEYDLWSPPKLRPSGCAIGTRFVRIADCNSVRVHGIDTLHTLIE